jgi:sRNA-binding carbon storage regulator CsrA
MLKIDLKPGESVRIGDVAVVTLEKKAGNTARLSVQADKSVPVTRVERPVAGPHIAAGGISTRS